MRGNRQPRGMTRRNGKTVRGENYAGDPLGVVKAWGGGAPGVDSPTSDSVPTLTLVYDENDDGTDTVDAKQGNDGTRIAEDGTKARLRTQFKTIANWLAMLMAIFSGTRSAKAIVVDGVGGASSTGTPGSVTVNAEAGGTSLPTPDFVRGELTVESGLFCGGFVSGGTTLLSGLNIANFVRNSVGFYTVTLKTPATDATRAIPFVTIGTIKGFAKALILPADTFTIAVFDETGAFVDTTFTFGAFHV